MSNGRSYNVWLIVNRYLTGQILSVIKSVISWLALTDTLLNIVKTALIILLN